MYDQENFILWTILKWCFTIKFVVLPEPYKKWSPYLKGRKLYQSNLFSYDDG